MEATMKANPAVLPLLLQLPAFFDQQEPMCCHGGIPKGSIREANVIVKYAGRLFTRIPGAKCRIAEFVFPKFGPDPYVAPGFNAALTKSWNSLQTHPRKNPYDVHCTLSISLQQPLRKL
jgi:hypothetical protein